MILMDDMEALRTCLGACGRTAEAVRTLRGLRPQTGSEMALELAEQASFAAEWGDDPVRQTWSAAAGILTAAEDHLRGLELLLAPGAKTAFAPFVVSRSAIESAARAWWLTEPGIGARARIARGMTERLYGLREQAKLPIPAARDLAASRTAMIQECAVALGFVVHDERRAIWIDDERRPGFTDVVTTLLGKPDSSLGEVVARYFSAVTHSTSYGVWQQFELDEGDSEELHGVTTATLVARPTTTAYLAAFPLMGYLPARQREIQAHGHPLDEWQSWSAHVHKSIAAVLRDDTENARRGRPS